MRKGEYTGLAQAYAFALKWVEVNGYICAGTTHENYIDGIWNKQSKQDWLTEIQIPVTKA